MTYVKVENGVTSLYTGRQLRADNPNTSFPSDLSPELMSQYGLHKLLDTPAPTYDPDTQVLTQTGYAPTMGGYTQGWTVTDLSPAERAKKKSELAAMLMNQLGRPDSTENVLLTVAFVQENRLRALEGKPAMTVQAFRAWVNKQLPA